MSLNVFTTVKLTHGCLADLRANAFPTMVHAWENDRLTLESSGTHFGLVQSGSAELECASGTFGLRSGMYFAVPGSMQITHGTGIIVSRIGYCGFFHLGGPVEDQGRLRYIDGCTDSLLIPPVRNGDACLNLLHLPPRTRQTEHTHPSLRVGLIIRGEGYCSTPEGRICLRAGLAFIIRANGEHSFHTEQSDLLVLAYHPDSDFGPTDDQHPMIQRTILNTSQNSRDKLT